MFECIKNVYLAITGYVQKISLKLNTKTEKKQMNVSAPIVNLGEGRKIIKEIKMEYTEKFNKLVQFIFDREGREYENNPADSGGETKYGISKKAFPSLNIKELTEDQAKEIYYKNYWLPMNCENYEIKLALCIFDCAVNQGCGMAKQILTELHPSILTTENYLLKRLRHYFNLCQMNPKLFVFLKDWVLRVIKCSEFIV